MGTDIHMSIVTRDGKFRHRNIFDGRNSEWFGNLQNRGWNSVYNERPSINGWLNQFIQDNIDVCPEDYIVYYFNC